MPKSWKVLSRFTEIKSPWLSLIGERLEERPGVEHEYWRVEKPDGLIIITIYQNQIIMPAKMYRPGVGEYTLDFCGGRIDGKNLEEQALRIVRRELGVPSLRKFKNITNIYKKPLNVDSSFTNVRIYAVSVELPDKTVVKSANIEKAYPLTRAGFRNLLRDLSCLQCRAVFLEWNDQMTH